MGDQQRRKERPGSAALGGEGDGAHEAVAPGNRRGDQHRAAGAAVAEGIGGGTSGNIDASQRLHTAIYRAARAVDATPGLVARTP